ncbi:hypothetical protein BGZ99_008900 [Dissophora globulifera]|uniref:Uncharacterized protein n=1 Tax=Dissophora globulifera TaxID=979702 RepID=A0A9P6R7A1_9FUNG|nr:hypothetical protein BGZ99_008900 [Dissophora globulifera]
MSNFNPPPTDGYDHCGWDNNGCPGGQTCFIYNGGSICQPFQPPAYPPVGADATAVNPPGWYITTNYPSVRYTGAIDTQTLGANCTTMPMPRNSDLYFRILTFVSQLDMGGLLSDIDQVYSTTLVQYRGNCAEGFYCQPAAGSPLTTTPTSRNQNPINVVGQLPGTCQPLRAANAACESSDQCLGWHIASNGSYNNDQFRCVQQPPNMSLPPPGNWTPAGQCTLIPGKGVSDANSSNSFLQKTARLYLLASALLIVVIIGIMWVRRRRTRQRLIREGVLGPDGRLIETARQGGVYRAPDETDNGELPAYGAHRRDERLAGPATEEIGMYAFSDHVPAVDEGDHSAPTYYPYPGSPQAYPPPPAGEAPAHFVALYHPPPPLTPGRPPLTNEEAEATAVMSDLNRDQSTAAQSTQGEALPPAYEPSQTSVVQSTPTEVGAVSRLTSPTSESVGEATVVSNDDAADPAEKKAQSWEPSSGAFSKEKDEHGVDDDKASTSSRSSGAGSSGSGSGSTNTK